jgi:hypothetical protein
MRLETGSEGIAGIYIENMASISHREPFSIQTICKRKGRLIRHELAWTDFPANKGVSHPAAASRPFCGQLCGANNGAMQLLGTKCLGRASLWRLSRRYDVQKNAGKKAEKDGPRFVVPEWARRIGPRKSPKGVGICLLIFEKVVSFHQDCA